MPIVPGFVSVIVVPAKSSTVSFQARARRMTASYALQNSAKSMFSQFLIDGTRSWRVPSSLAMSIARPRLMCTGLTSVGLPSTTSYAAFIAGMSASARTIA